MPRQTRKKIPLVAPDSQTSKEAILSSLLQAFARDGYDGASLPKIAKLANVAPPLIHYYFGSKDQLWRATVDFSLGELRREAASISLATRTLAPLDRLRVLLQAHILFAAKWPDHFFMIVAEARTASDRFLWLQENYTGVLFEDVVSILRDARESGVMRDVCLDQLAIILIGGILVYFTVYPSRPSEDVEKLANDFADLMFGLVLRGVVLTDSAT